MNQAACAAYGAAVLVMKLGFTVERAIARTGSCTNYVEAMKWIIANNDEDFLDRVLRGRVKIFAVANRVRPLVELRAAYKKLTSAQRIAWAAEENPNTLFDEVIAPAAAMVGTAMQSKPERARTFWLSDLRECC